MMKKPYQYLINIFCLYISIHTYASHEIYYELIDSTNYTYRITIEKGGSASTRVAIYSHQTKALINSYSASYDSTVVLNFPLEYRDPRCFKAGDMIQYKSFFSDTITLPPIIGGYDIAYQFNSGGYNIESGQGMTFYSHIPDTAIAKYNSAPMFIDTLTLLIQNRDTIDFFLNAVDKDGDSLVYSLCTPYVGSDSFLPQPLPRELAEWRINGREIFSEEDMLGILNATITGEMLTYDLQTGELGGIPGLNRDFFISACVKEYRNDILLSEHMKIVKLISVARFDLKSDIVAQIDLEDTLYLCEEYEIELNNITGGATEILWNFGDPTTDEDEFFYKADSNYFPPDTPPSFYPTYTYPDTGSYLVTLIADNSLNNCADTAYQVVNISLKSLIADFEIPDQSCAELEIPFVDQSIDSIYDIIAWDWSFGDGDTGIEQSPIHEYERTGTYKISLTVTPSSRCSMTVSKDIIIWPEYNMKVSDDHTIMYGQSAELSVENVASAIWYTDLPLADSTALTQTVSPSETTTYYVEGTSKRGCTDFDSVLVTVFSLFVPNAITPNGDGNNDELRLQTREIEQYDLKIYNRQGKLIFQTNEHSLSWNGTFNGTALPSGVYHYVIETLYASGKRGSFIGEVTLLR